MRKLLILIGCSVGILFLLAACENREESEIQLGKKFINELYNVNEESIAPK
ncbi:hypothetical protein [Ornithinibacillus contaminans]|uniref:hypothetical protein n=1 Tax=Ornithinibacillus contaminans TaxID=694055 RepID=UPI0012ED65B8|nr:hypothetical protein [Ornithinibacillus contaminans]